MPTLRHNIRYHILLYFISPVLGLLYGIKTRSEQYIRWSIFAFTVIFGSLLNFSILGGDSTRKGGKIDGADGARHFGEVYRHYQDLDFSVWWSELIAILKLAPLDTTNDDPYIHFISFFVGTILNAPGLFFVVVAIVYAYFFSGSIVKILGYVDWKSKNNKFFFYYFLIFFILWKNPVDMQTVRTWTGMWMLFYAVISYHQTKKKKYLVLVLMPPLIHVAFLAMCIPVWIVLFSGYRNPKLYFIIFIFSTLVSNVTEQMGALDTMQQTEVGAKKTKAYYSDDEKNEEREKEIEKKDANFYKKYEQYRIHYFVFTAIIIFMYVILRKRGFGIIENTLFSYGLALAAFANFFTIIFALHSRTWQVAGTFILSLIVIFLSKQNFKNIPFSSLKIKLPFLIFSLALIPYVFFKISAILNFTSMNVILLPILAWIEIDTSVSIRSVLGYLL